MAARYLTALDYSDWHTHNILRKHAKNRPLGQLECRYQYTQQQPLLSCRTVEMDASNSGTRTYVKSAGQRSMTSSPSVVQEQQKALRQLLANGRRAVTSAPSLRSQSRKGGGQTTPDSSNAQSPKRVPGRPSTSMSTSSGSSRPKSTASSCRSKATSRPKSSKSTTSESFMVLKVDKDMLRTRQTYHDLTNRIHAHWRPGSSNLNQGHYRRGQRPPDDVPMAADDWLTFGGANGEGTKGVIDAFANFNNPDTYYNIGGSVGSRVAQQLRKGGKIRIGINGEVVSHDLRIKKWVKDEEDPDEAVAPKEEVEENKQIEEDEEEKSEGDPESVSENPPSPVTPDTEQEEDFGELVVDSFENLSPTEEKEDAGRAPDSPGRALVHKTPFVDFPLNWDDQVTRPEVKVMCARRPPTDNNRKNLCETHPVVFNPCTCRFHGGFRLPSTSSENGYRIKQRPVYSSNSDNNNIANSTAAVRNRLDSASGNKVRAIMIDQNSEEEDQRLKEMSIEEVIQTRLEVAASAAPSPTPGMRRARSSLGPRTEGLSRVGGEGELGRSSSSMSAFGQWRDRGESRGVGKRAVRSSTERDSLRANSPGDKRLPSPSSGERRLGVPRPSSSVPFQGARDVRELGNVRPTVMSSRGSGARPDRQGSGKGPRPMTGLPVYRGPGSGGVSSINAGPMPGDAHFIQISTPIRNPNASHVPLVTGLRSFYSPFPVNSMAASPVPPYRPYSPPRSNTPENMQGDDPEMTAEGSILAALSRSMTPSIQGDMSFREIDEQEAEESSLTLQAGAAQGVLKVEDPSREALTPVSGAALPATPGPVHVIQAINIPTGNEVEEEEDEEGAEAQKGERSASQDQQIDQVAHLLVKAVLAGDGT